MQKGKVVGNIVSTNKFDSLRGYKFLEIRLIEEVLVVTGSSARVAVGDPNAPVDAVVVGIIDKT